MKRITPAIARLITALLMMTGPAATGARAESLPLWEAGMGVTVLGFPDYRGSNERQTWVLPFPYLVYRGEFLQADERRMRGLFFKTDRLEVDVSVNGSVPVDSSENEARRGMPDLDATLEIGPALNVLLLRSDDRRTRVELRLPVRAVLASDFSHVRHVGWIFHPHVSADVDNPLGYAGWKLGLLAGPLFTDQRYNRYFYDVEAPFVTATRPLYAAGGGYAGAQVIGALSKRYREFWVGGFVKWDTVGGATFADSPLVRERQSLSVGIAVAWILGKSGKFVEVTQ
jgi:outer membrane protein